VLANHARAVFSGRQQEAVRDLDEEALPPRRREGDSNPLGPTTFREIIRNCQSHSTRKNDQEWKAMLSSVRWIQAATIVTLVGFFASAPRYAGGQPAGLPPLLADYITAMRS